MFAALHDCKIEVEKAQIRVHVSKLYKLNN